MSALPSVALPASLALLALASFIAVLASWDAAARALDGAWAAYAKWSNHCIRALHLPLGPRDFALRHALAAAAGFAAGLALGSAIRALLLGTIAAIAPLGWMRQQIKQRRKALEAQLDAALQTIANNMLATQNVVDGFAAVAMHLPPPVSQEAELVVKDVKVGARIEEALADLSQRCQSQHVDAVVTALSIGLRTGGDLGKVLKKIAFVVRETIRCEELMAAKTSEGKTSAAIVGVMPMVLAVIMYRLMPEWMAPLWNTLLGSLLVAVAVLLDLVGVALVLKISKVDP
jgi:tight adherence protein B